MELTSEVARIGYIAILVVGLVFFAVRRRQFDFLPVAYIGVAFYFLPLLSGHVLQSSPALSSSIPPFVYLIASAFILALVAAAALAPDPPVDPAPPSSAMAGPLLLLAVFGLVAALVQSGGAVIQLDKVKALQQIGIFYVLFETLASLACIAAVIERRWVFAVAATVLLAIDLLAGFRNYATLTSLAVVTVLLAPQGPIRLYRKALTYGTGLAAVVVIMLLLHSARFVIFEQMIEASTPPPATAPATSKPTAPVRLPVGQRLFRPVRHRLYLPVGTDCISQSGTDRISRSGTDCISRSGTNSISRSGTDCIARPGTDCICARSSTDCVARSGAGRAENSAFTQRYDFIQEAIPLRKSPVASSSSSREKATEPSGPHWLSIMRQLIEQSEPYIIQATLVATVDTGLSCRASNILKSAWLLVPPGMLRFAPKNPYPATFYLEYQPILYPNITYGTAGNIWAEMLCRFGNAGLVVFGVVLILLLLWLGRLLVTVPTAFRAPIAFAGAVLAFYIHRNDLNFTLVVIKQVTYVFLAAYLLFHLKQKIVSTFSRAPASRTQLRGKFVPTAPADRGSRLARLIWGLLMACIILVVVRLFLPDMIWLAARKIAVTDIKPEAGHRLVGTFSDQTLSKNMLTTARLDFVERKPGGFLHILDLRLEDSWAFTWLTSLYDINYPGRTHEIVWPLQPGNSTDADIAERGGGRYSVSEGRVSFSPPVGKTARDLNRAEIWVPYSEAVAKYEWWPRVVRWGSGGLVVALLIALLWTTPAWLADSLWPGVTIAFVTMLLLFAGSEYYMHATGKFPKTMMTWPVTFSPETGVVFKPHSIVRYTDGVEFWSEDTTNSLGFLDNEPVIPKPDGTFRILLVGDSIVEALQVPVAKKTQTNLAAAFRKAYPDRKVDVFAVARSGFGQGSQLGIYNASRRINPDLVILMFVSNDFANNSILLELIRSGFGPDHRPWWFPTIDADKRCKLVPPSQDWEKYLLANPAERIPRLRARSSADARLVDTLIPDFVDSVFYRNTPLPEIYQQAVELTKCSFSLWKEAAERDGFKLLIVATDDVTIAGKSGQIDRIKALSSELQIPLFDLYPAWVSHGIPDGKFKFDGHWNARGHQWSADAIFDYLVSNQLAGRPASQK